MGHDITCYKVSNEEQFRLRASLNLEDYQSPGWIERYELYEERTQAAYLRRSAGNPLNVIVYRALDCEDVYGGCSGTGEAKTFTREQIVKAIGYVSKLARDGVGILERERNLADDMVLALTGQNDLPRVCEGGDVTPELRFLCDVADYMAETGKNSVEIFFG